MTVYDVAVVGAGIAGASVASEIAADCSVVLLEAEDQPGYHATGRSAAFWTETYGGPGVQPLTTASGPFLQNPPPDFSERSFLVRRGAINIAPPEEAWRADRFVERYAESGVAMDRWSADQLQKTIPPLRPEWNVAIYEPDCCDIDVGGLHMAYLRYARRGGVNLQCRARVEALKFADGMWDIQTAGESYKAATVVNAAGAWADEIAAMAGVAPIGIEPLRRTMVQIESDPPSSPDDHLVVALDGSFYFKPEAGGSYWLSPHDEITDTPRDVAPEEMDVAVAIDRFQNVMDVKVRAVTRKWAGLRSFAPDRLPVYGFDPASRSFFWCAGQGGFGIQTAPAAAKLCKSLLLGDTSTGISMNMSSKIERTRYDPVRFTARRD